MSGGYPDAPGQRLAYDTDGTTLVFRRTSGTGDVSFYPAGSSQQVALNNESNDVTQFQGSVLTHWTLFFYFLEPRDLFGVWTAGTAADIGDVVTTAFEYSDDSTAHTNGTWTSAGGMEWEAPIRVWDTWREEVEPFDSTASVAFRFILTGQGALDFSPRLLKQVHIYGTTNDAATPDRVIFLDKVTGLEFDAVYDWDYLPRGTIKEKAIQVKNNSTTLQANDVTLAFSSLQSFNPDAWMEMKDGGGSYSTGLSLGNLAANTTYANDITLKIDVGSTSGFGPISIRLENYISGWT